MTDGTRYFMHFYRGASATFFFGALIGTTVIIVLHGFELDPADLLVGLGCGAVGAFVSQFLLSRLAFIQVTPHGIAASTFWGRHGFLRWDEIHSVRRYYVFPIGLVHVRSQGRSPALWLPTHVHRQTNLAEELRRLAPTGCLLLGQYVE